MQSGAFVPSCWRNSRKRSSQRAAVAGALRATHANASPKILNCKPLEDYAICHFAARSPCLRRTSSNASLSGIPRSPACHAANDSRTASRSCSFLCQGGVRIEVVRLRMRICPTPFAHSPVIASQTEIGMPYFVSFGQDLFTNSIQPLLEERRAKVRCRRSARWWTSSINGGRKTRRGPLRCRNLQGSTCGFQCSVFSFQRPLLACHNRTLTIFTVTAIGPT